MRSTIFKALRGHNNVQSYQIGSNQTSINRTRSNRTYDAEETHRNYGGTSLAYQSAAASRQSRQRKKEDGTSDFDGKINGQMFKRKVLNADLEERKSLILDIR